MLNAPIPRNEQQRLESLRSLSVLDTPMEERFDRITKIAQKLFDVPVSTLSLVDSNREWFKSCQGLDATEGPRVISFCGHAMLADGLFVIPNTLTDPRFSNNPMVTGKPYIRFYAGQYLRGPGGYKIGTFCIKDYKPREFSAEHLKLLTDLAIWAEIELNSKELGHALEERRRNEERLGRMVEEKVKDIRDMQFTLDQHLSVAVTDVDGKFNLVNDKLCEISKYAREELLGQDYRVVNSGHHSKEFMKELWRTIKQGHVWKGEIKNKAKDGSYFWVNTTIVPFLDDNGRPYQYIAIHTNITSRILYQERLQEQILIAEESRKKAQEASQVKSAFLSNMSHEIRTPMNAIIGFSSLLAKTPLNEKQASYIDQVQSSGQLLLGIIDDILDVSKLEAGKIKLESLDFNLEDLIHDVFKMLAVRMHERPFDTYVDMEYGLSPYVKGDPKRLTQILVNLLGNAFKFTSQGSIGIIVKKQSPSPDPDLLEYLFIVKDTGIGIAPDSIEKLFKPFTQADGSTTRKFGGTGLGLSICKSLVEAMGGRIWLESQLGHGSQFMFTVKFKAGSTVEQEGMGEYRKALEGKRVFIIDDNQIARSILGKCCDQIGLKSIGEAASPQAALQKLDTLAFEQEIVPDLVLCDIIMEGMNGYELVEKIRSGEKYKGVKFIAVTADITAERDGQKKQEVFDAYIVKPINVKGLVKVIAKVMGHEGEIVSKEKDEISSYKGIKVLVAEDSTVNQMLLKEYFDQLGCEVDFANNGDEAVEKLRSNRYSLVLMDLHMPVMGGIEATGIIRREISKDMPVIALTASVMKADQERATEAGMTDFLTKPVSFYQLREKIEQYGKIGPEK